MNEWVQYIYNEHIGIVKLPEHLTQCIYTWALAFWAAFVFADLGAFKLSKCAALKQN